jgi:hypothetical protein
MRGALLRLQLPEKRHVSLGSIDETAGCPISTDALAALYRAESSLLAGMVAALPPLVRARLALHCYGRAHLRDIGLTIAASCAPADLERLAGVTGRVLADQCKNPDRSSGTDGARASSTLRSRISLAKSAA